MKWYRKAAEQGHAEAQYKLGGAYDTGRGVPKDSTEAAKWHRKAVEQGLAPAQFSLGVLYYDGRGVPKDNYLPYFWYSLSATSGAGEEKERAARKRDRVAGELTTEQLLDAQRMIRWWEEIYPEK